MYVPNQHEESRLDILHGLIRAHPLGAWTTTNAEEIVADHIPFFLDSSRGEYGTLIAHVARANPVWQSLSEQKSSLVIFQGPQAYITPAWYPAKREHGKVVPTWNYAVVHAYGVPRAIHDAAWILAALNRLTDINEAGRSVPWSVADAPPEFIESLLGAIVGIEIPIQRLIGKWKIHQHRTDAEKSGVIVGLNANGDARSVEVAELMRQSINRRNDERKF